MLRGALAALLLVPCAATAQEGPPSTAPAPPSTASKPLLVPRFEPAPVPPPGRVEPPPSVLTLQGDPREKTSAGVLATYICIPYVTSAASLKDVLSTLPEQSEREFAERRRIQIQFANQRELFVDISHDAARGTVECTVVDQAPTERHRKDDAMRLRERVVLHQRRATGASLGRFALGPGGELTTVDNVPIYRQCISLNGRKIGHYSTSKRDVIRFSGPDLRLTANSEPEGSVCTD